MAGHHPAVWHYNKNGKYSAKSGRWLHVELRGLERGGVGGSGGEGSVSSNKVKVACQNYISLRGKF